MSLNKLEQTLDGNKLSILQSALDSTIQPMIQRDGMQSTRAAPHARSNSPVASSPGWWAVRQALSETGYGNEDGDGSGGL